MDSVASVAAARQRTLAITTDGNLYAWGYGILGDGVERGWNDPALSPVWIMDSVVSVTTYDTSESVGNYTTFAIRTDGSLWAWGSGQLGDGVARNMWSENAALLPVRIMDSVASVYTDYDRVFAIQTDGSLWSWGSTQLGLLGCGTMGDWDDNRLTPLRVMDSVASVWIGWGSTMVIRTDGSLWAWGYGMLGDGVDRSYENPLITPVRIMDDVAMVAGQRALKTDGSLWTWGYNWSGQIGDGTTETRLFPVRIMDSVETVLDTIGGYSMVIRSDSSLWAWGSNFGGQLGDGNASGYDYGNGEVVFYEDYGAIADDDYTYVDYDRHSPFMVTDSVAAVSTFSHYFPGSTIVIKDDGSLQAWGTNSNGQLGDGTTEPRFSPYDLFDGAQWIGTNEEPVPDPDPDPDDPTKPIERPDTSPKPPAETEESPEPPEEEEDSPGRPRRRDPADNADTSGSGDLLLVLLIAGGGVLVIGAGVLVVLLVTRKKKEGSQ